MRPDVGAHVAKCGLYPRHIVDPIEQHEVVDHAVVSSRRHGDAGLLELARVGLTFVAKYIVLGGGSPARAAGRATVRWWPGAGPRSVLSSLRVGRVGLSQTA